MVDPYTDEDQKAVVEKLHDRTTPVAVEAMNNSEVNVYLRSGMSITNFDMPVDSYRVTRVGIPQEDGPFSAVVTLSPHHK